MNGHIIGFGPQTQKLESPYKTPSNTLAVKGLNTVVSRLACCFFISDEAESADDVTSGSEVFPELPDFFSHKHFMLYGEIERTARRLLIRYITAYNG